MTWVLIICTQAWGLCGMYREVSYETEQQCYRAQEDLYKHHGAAHFKFLVCEPRRAKDGRHD